MRRSKRNINRPRVVYYGERPREEKQADTSVGALLGASPDAGTRRNLTELSALGQMEAAARERDEVEEVARQRRKARRSTIASRASLGTPHASQLSWTSAGDDGEDGDTEEEAHGEAVLTDVEENDDEG